MHLSISADRPRRGHPSTVRRWLAVAATLLLIAVAGLRAADASAADLPVGGPLDAAKSFLLAPNDVPGANDPRCRATAGQETPVILVHGTFGSPGVNFTSLGPRLRNAGYCTYSFSYGQLWYSFGRIGGLGDIATSAGQLNTFVESVRKRTGAKRVDLVGHSQGGLMPNYYLKRLGGADKVRRFVGLAPDNHGTTAGGLTVELPKAFFGLGTGLFKAVSGVLDRAAPALTQQIQGSPFQEALFADGDTVKGPRYTVIATERDEVVTPYTNGFLAGPGVDNIRIQDLCPDDPTGHVGIVFDLPAAQLVMNALGKDDPDFRPDCKEYGLPL